MNQTTINPNYKNGVKTLNEIQMTNGLPGYSLLKNKIEKIREEATKVDRNSLINSSFESIKYDNFFSILGGRGAGKTSILMTISNYYRDKSENIVLPIIMPELIDKKDNFIGWILAAMEYNLRELEEKIKEYGYRKEESSYLKICEKNKLFERCQFNHRNNLREKFEQLKKSYYTRSYVSYKKGEDYSMDMELISSVIDNNFSLIDKFTEYWNMLIEVYSEYIKAKEKNDTMPLIFVIMDDTDLKPQIINELVFTIPKLFSHPNVVVIISASQKTLNYAVKNHMYKSITGNPFDLMSLMELEYKYNGFTMKDIDEYGYKVPNTVRFRDLRYGKEYNKICQLTNEILRKLFPVCNRFYLKKYDKYEDKGLLQYFDPETESTVDISKMIAQKLNDFLNFTINQHTHHKKFLLENDQMIYEKVTSNKIENFNIIQSGEDVIISSKMHLSFLGECPRDIINVYLALNDTLEELKECVVDFYRKNTNYTIKKDVPDSFVNRIYSAVLMFLDAAVISNKKLRMFITLTKDIIIKHKQHWKLYVDYSVVLDVFSNSRYIAQNRVEPDAFVEMICLLNFIEQLIVLIMPERKKSHGYDEFKELMTKCNIGVIRNSSDLTYMLNQYYWYYSFKVIPRFYAEKEEHANNFLNATYIIEGLNDHINYSNRLVYNVENSEWFDLFYDVLYKRFSKISVVTKNKEEFMLLKRSTVYDEKYNYLFENYYKTLHDLVIDLNEKEKKTFPKKNMAIVETMNRNINEMNKTLNSLQIVPSFLIEPNIITETLENMVQELDRVIIEKNLKKTVDEFVFLLCSPNSKIYYFSYANTLDKIKNIIEKEEDYQMFLYGWYRRFIKILNEYFMFNVSDESYNLFCRLCEKIVGNAKPYITQMLNKYNKSDISQRNTGVIYFENYIKENLSDYFYSQEEKDWADLMEGIYNGE